MTDSDLRELKGQTALVTKTAHIKAPACAHRYEEAKTSPQM